ncbi:MAG: Mannose permease IID component [Smithella sp. PtaU1.Bin162]|nr:MAG: Mannose permease IID component [Smithella sp. PtaU1.Bin162]
MNKSVLVRAFLRSFFIQATLNFRRMQNLGFAMAIIPVIQEWNLTQKDEEELLTRHLQLFNTHPYLSAAVIGSVIRLEEEQNKSRQANPFPDAVEIKQVLAGPYAAIGDTFFWGALRPFAAIAACVLAYLGYVFAAPLAFLLLYTPAHVWIRVKGFLEGYRRGKQGIEFVRLLDLPGTAVKIRWVSLVTLAGLATLLIGAGDCLPLYNLSGILIKLAVISAIFICILLVQKRISQFYILYGAVLFFLLISSLKEF